MTESRICRNEMHEIMHTIDTKKTEVILMPKEKAIVYRNCT